jgi:uncharacterized protein YndB with AHSA1/START domain
MSTTEALADIHKTITVEVPVEEAFETFTRRITSWWPQGSHSVFEDRLEVIVFEERAGGRVYERSVDGEEADWADVLTWEPPTRIVLRWRVNPGRASTEVEVRFVGAGDSTRVELDHRGWDAAGDPAGRAGYQKGWDYVLGQFVEALQT